MKKIGWILVGASTVAREWMVDAIGQQGDAEVLAVVSRDAARGAAFAAQFGIAASYTDLDAALAHPGADAVYISTTNEWHMAQTLQAARAGKHVLCEKPLALNLEDARRMVDGCAEAGVVLGINHHLRNAATHGKVRELIRAGEIGQPLYGRVLHANNLPQHLRGWRLDAPESGGVTLDMFVHDVDTLRFLLDSEPRHVTACATSGGMTVAGLEEGLMAVIEFDLQGRILAANENFLNLVGYRLEDVLGLHHSIFCEPGYVTSPDYSAFWQHLAQGEFNTGEYKRIDRAGREVWIHASYNPIFNTDGKPFKVVKLATDVSERRAMQENLRAAKDRAELAAESKTSFLANMSHEIRTPMNAIIGFTEVLLGTALDSLQRRHLGTVRQSARSLLELLNDILDTAKLEKGATELELVDFSLPDLVDHVAASLRITAHARDLVLHV
ncbi:MAG: Gfo/Idh/MocA family oxidoreductase, partial [Janthinobacterium sp.]